jgi:1-acyl-sn-glycerol-3-phosphate acyltransferase
VNAPALEQGPAAAKLLSVIDQLVREAHPGQSCTVTLHSSLERDLGLDSLARAELMQRVGQAFSVELPAEALAEADTPQALLRFLAGAAPASAPESPASLSSIPVVDIPENASTLLDVLEWHVERQPEQTHILLHDGQHPDDPVHYRELFDAARGIAAGLARVDVQPQQAVALMLPTGRDYLATFFGVIMAGAIPVPIYPPARMAQVEDHLRRHARILSNAGASVIITVDQARPVAVMLRADVPGLAAIVTPEELRAPPVALRYRPQADDTAFLQYTSGSTGDPKGVVLTHANLLANIRALGQAARAGQGDVFVSWLPLYHDMGLIGAWFGSLYHGMPLVLMSPPAFLARPALWLQAITRYRGTISAAPNFAYELCIRHVSDAAIEALDLSTWRLALNGAEPVSPATLERFAARFAGCSFRHQAMTPVYGLAESSVGLAFPPLERGPRLDVVRRQALDRDRKAVPAANADEAILSIPACGRPLPGHAIRIVDDTGFELPERQVGRLEFRGPSATSGYFHNPAATGKLLREGWLDSGDYAYMADGEVYVAGRVKDLIKRGGRNLYPYDLEEAAGNVPGIRKGCVAVFASPDPATATERLVIMAETRERDEAARARLRDRLNGLAIDIAGAPADDIVLVPPHSVLKTSSGKIRRLACREAYERGMPAMHATAPRLHAGVLAVRTLLAHARIASRRTFAWLYGAYAWMVFVMLALPCGALIMLLRRPALGRRVARAGPRLLFRLTGASLSASGLDRLPREPHVLLVNHASYLDAIVLTALLPAVPGYAFAAKRELEVQPLMRRMLSGLGTLYIERKEARQGVEDVHSIATALRRGESVVVFPEGTFWREAGLRTFHAGSFAAAAEASAPIVLSGLRGTRAALRGETWRPRRTPIEFEVGEVMAPPRGDWADTVRAAEAARTAMVPLSGEFTLPG